MNVEHDYISVKYTGLYYMKSAIFRLEFKKIRRHTRTETATTKWRELMIFIHKTVYLVNL